jgi:2-methylisocitrate lyase-like PEP mutase family enzyme
MNQTQKAEAFKKLHEGPGAFVMPNPWDAGSARFLENMGFKALATTSAGIAYGLGKPDGVNAVTRAENLANAVAIAAVTDVPVSGDLEGGFGTDPLVCAETIQLAAKAGLVGGSIEDSTGNRDDPIYEMGFAVERIRAAAEAAHSLDFSFMLTARAENFLHGRPDLNDTIRRLQAFQEAGADVLFAPGLKTKDDIRAVTSSVDGPVSVVMGLSGMMLSVDELADLGVRRISTGGSLARMGFGAMLRGAREILVQGTFGYSANAVPDAEISALFGRHD